MSNRTWETRSKFLRLTFQNYYQSNHANVDEPNKIHTREFAFEDWEYTWSCPKGTKKDDSGNVINYGCDRSGIAFNRYSSCPYCGSTDIMVTNWTRHIGFRTQKALLKELVDVAPHSVYHSAAFYNIPVARDKGWQGAELVFDIDADHLDSPCTREHDSWRCNGSSCLETGTGPPPNKGCPKCGGLSFITRNWLCDRCLEDAKRETIKVRDDFLIKDFGIDPEYIQLNFSGHRGYHLRVRDPRVFHLDSDGRTEIAHYIIGMGFRIAPAKETSPTDSHRVIIVSKNVPLPTKNNPQLDVPGWGNRVAEAIIDFIRNIDTYDGEERWVRLLRANKEAAIKGLMRNPPILSPKVKGIGDKFWQEIAVKSVESFGGEIDVPVTHDIGRVIRLIGSLNGKTGFSVKILTRDEIDQFDPFSDALAVTKGILKVRFDGVLPVPKIRIGDDTYGPFHKESVELPMEVAVFMLCKGVATIE
jgi:DNA primase small subunit